MFKKFFFLVAAILMLFTAQSQSPDSIYYQGVLLDASGNPLTNQSISVQVKILKGSATGSVIYTETHSTTTDTKGRFNIFIGGGTTTDDFSAIPWSSDKFFCNILIDPNGGTSYSDYGTFQFVSVPYALYADTAGVAINDQDTDPQNELQTLSDVLSQGNSAGNNTIQDLQTPTNDYDAANKIYVDNAVSNAAVNNRHYVYAVLTITNSLTLTNSFQVIKFNSEKSDDENLYDPSTGEYTVDGTGYYLINFSLDIDQTASTSTIMITIKEDGTAIETYSIIIGSDASTRASHGFTFIGHFTDQTKITIEALDNDTTNPRTIRSGSLEIIRL